ncbi:DNA methyltransferase [Parabacteroides sp. PF5-9]|uniref:DNA methyltransferase n=1 Tax=Parabacteroides sp. PF5-9 TaxID=1742404 RepID=UPI0024744C13|nr:DNA methyltransferase [Parabacteroides sp. PF5-9]MDH6357078.1 DNA modification methylase [Parabacteroides sp. PF5-9]
MIVTMNDIHLIDFNAIPIDNFWNIGEEKENKMHRIHAYPAKFPAFITTKALQYVNERGGSIEVIADVFCGCGTTAYEATRNQKNFWGCDINPVATLIARTKSRNYDQRILDIYYQKILDRFSKLNVTNIGAVNDRIKYWFKDEQISDLLKLKSAIYYSVRRIEYRDFFLCAFSNILKPTSIWLTKSIKPTIDKAKNPANVLTSFSSQYSLMRKANMENLVDKSLNINIENINFLEKEIHHPFADLIVTSPPYVTSYEYADLHQLSTLWLGYTDDFRSFRDGTIGSLYHNSNFEEDSKLLNTTATKVVSQLYKVDKGKAKSAAKYYVDMQKCIQKTFDLLNMNGYALFVIGDTEYKSVRIDNAKHLVESMINYGYTEIEVTRRKISNKILSPYRDENGKFTSNSNSRKVYAEEFIVIGKKGNSYA